MQMRRDFSIWLVIWIQVIVNINTQEICSVQEVSKTVLTEHINQTDVVTLTVVRLLFVQTVAVNVWVATLSLVAKKYGKEKIFV